MHCIVSKIRSNKKNSRHDVQLNHGFRKRFNTILKKNKDINPNIAERLMGHFSKTIPLDTSYFKPTIEDLFSEFRKVIQDLTIDNSERNKIAIAKLEAEKSDLEKKTMKIAELEETIAKVVHKLDIVEKTVIKKDSSS